MQAVSAQAVLDCPGRVARGILRRQVPARPVEVSSQLMAALRFDGRPLAAPVPLGPREDRLAIGRPSVEFDGGRDREAMRRIDETVGVCIEWPLQGMSALQVSSEGLGLAGPGEAAEVAPGQSSTLWCPPG